MPRPKRCRKICGFPDYWNFAPEEADVTETILFMLDEYEVIRLIDYEKRTQEECACAMGVSRATIAGIYERARYKMADAMVNGKRIRITGGAYRFDSIPAEVSLPEKTDGSMRVAVTYDEGMVGQHFGKTEQFDIYDIEGGEILSAQIVGTNGVKHAVLAGFLHAAKVDILICGGVGMGARNALREVRIKLISGVSGNVDEVIRDYLEGKIVNDSQQ